MYQSLIKAIENYIIKADESLADILKREGYIKSKKTLEYIQQLENGTAEALLSQRDYILKEIEKSVDLETFFKEIWEQVKSNDILKIEIASLFEYQLKEFMPEFVNYYIQQTDRQLQLAQVSQKTISWIESWSQELGKIMQLNSHNEIESIIKRGLEQGSGIPEITRKIMESGIRNEYYKARRVAVTEVLTAHRAAQQEGFMQSPAVKEKMWKHTGSYRNRPRQNHIRMNGQRVPKQDPYVLIGADGNTYYPMYPGDTCLPARERINCHCLSQPAVDDDILGLSLEERQELQRKAVQEMNDKWKKETNERENTSINENTVKYDWLKNKTVDERKKYFESDSRWALFESGVIQNDTDLEKLYKTVNTEKKIKKEFKTLTELKQDGIITVSNATLDHSSLGKWTTTNRLEGGGHGQQGMSKLLNTGVKPVIYKEYSNGVKIGSVPNHKNATKKTGSHKPDSDIGQSWFPKNWNDDKILLAGTFTANKGIEKANGVIKTAVYENVEIIVFMDNGQPGTICPNNMRQPKGDEWEYARDK